ncbi:MAG: germination protein YpeB [Clostridia bacterium]|nr:germination protein YpeB [Clostridia bacterium]
MKKKTINFLKAGIIILLLAVIAMGVTIYAKQEELTRTTENNYNMAFYELVDYVKNVETYLAKAQISTTPEHSAETLTNLWREANLAQSYLTMLPIESQELENTEKFLNQVSDYSYSLSRKNIYNESLSDEDFKNLKDLHSYSVELTNTLIQLSSDIESDRITWKDLSNDKDIALAQQVDNISKESFNNMEENFHEYSGLIYDGAFSEHMTNSNKKGLTGDDIDEEKAKQKVEEIIGKENITNIQSFGLSQNANIEAYNFALSTTKNENVNIAITKKGGHLLYMNSNRNVNTEILQYDEVNELGKKYLTDKGFPNMKETYYIKQDGVITINYAYEQDGVVMYPDLIKLKIALDDGEILGVETTGYLNNHEERNLENINITKEQAKEKINKELEILSEGLAVIPTKWQTEVLCYEFKGKIDGTEFLVYINAETGIEQDILVIKNTPNGVLTM